MRITRIVQLKSVIGLDKRVWRWVKSNSSVHHSCTDRNGYRLMLCNTACFSLFLRMSIRTRRWFGSWELIQNKILINSSDKKKNHKYVNRKLKNKRKNQLSKLVKHSIIWGIGPLQMLLQPSRCSAKEFSKLKI